MFKLPQSRHLPRRFTWNQTCLISGGVKKSLSSHNLSKQLIAWTNRPREPLFSFHETFVFRTSATTLGPLACVSSLGMTEIRLYQIQLKPAATGKHPLFCFNSAGCWDHNNETWSIFLLMAYPTLQRKIVVSSSIAFTSPPTLLGRSSKMTDKVQGTVPIPTSTHAWIISMKWNVGTSHSIRFGINLSFKK